MSEVVISFFRLKGEARNLRYNVRDGGHIADSLHGKKTKYLNPKHFDFILQFQAPPSPVDFTLLEAVVNFRELRGRD